jgi:hypothetical protein
MPNLYLDQNLKPTFEKMAASVKLSDNPENWQREIASEVFKQVPYLSDFSVNVVLDRVDQQRGYAFGSAEVSNQTDSPLPDQPESSVHIPIIVKDRLMQPLDVMLDGKEAMPLNERRLREKLFRTAAFETSTRKPTDQGMVDQLYPPMRTNYGYGNAVSTGVGVGGFGKQASANYTMHSIGETDGVHGYQVQHPTHGPVGVITVGHGANGPEVRHDFHPDHAHVAEYFAQQALALHSGMPKQASLCEAIGATVSEPQYDLFCKKLASDEETRLLFAKNPELQKIAKRMAQRHYTSAEKTAHALVQSIKPTVVQFTKLASGKFLVKWANAGAFAPQQAQVGAGDASAMAGQDLSGMQPGTTMTVSTQRAQMQGLDEPSATVIKDFGDYAVQNADTGESLVGTVMPVVDFQMQPLELFVFTDGAGHYGTQDEITGVRQDGPGGMALQQPEPGPEAGAPPAGDPSMQQGAPQPPPADPQAGMPKMAMGLPATIGIGAGIGGAVGLHEMHRLKKKGMTKTAGVAPDGDGVFLYTPDPTNGGKPFCTLPITISAATQGPDGTNQLMAEDLFGGHLTLVMTPGLSTFEPLDEDGTIAIPDDMQWVPLQGEAVHLAKGDTPDAAANAKGLSNEVDVKSTGPGETSMDGLPLAKVARAERWFQKTAEAIFLLCAMGLTQDEATEVIKEAERRPSHLVKLAGLRSITPLAEVHEEMEKRAFALLQHFDYSFWRRDLVKEAAALEDSETADKVLAMNFINPENLSIFASYLPDLDTTSTKLAEMLLASRLGMNQVPEGAAERAMKNMEEVIGGLRSLQQKELI